MTGLLSLLKQGSMSSLIAAIVNFILGCLKFGAYVITGNVAMFAEMMHSFGDAANQFLFSLDLLFQRKAKRKVSIWLWSSC